VPVPVPVPVFVFVLVLVLVVGHSLWPPSCRLDGPRPGRRHARRVVQGVAPFGILVAFIVADSRPSCQSGN
jgi:hypothetical protein